MKFEKLTGFEILIFVSSCLIFLSFSSFKKDLLTFQSFHIVKCSQNSGASYSIFEGNKL